MMWTLRKCNVEFSGWLLPFFTAFIFAVSNHISYHFRSEKSSTYTGGKQQTGKYGISSTSVTSNAPETKVSKNQQITFHCLTQQYLETTISILKLTFRNRFYCFFFCKFRPKTNRQGHMTCDDSTFMFTLGQTQ